MSIIIRLQNLPWTGSALDIRRFFAGLQIPDGGVHIVGGDKGEAFIAFATDEDARKSMMLNGQCIGDAPIQLFLSSKVEMQNSIAVARGMAVPIDRQPASGDVESSPRPVLLKPPLNLGNNRPGFSNAVPARVVSNEQGDLNDLRSPMRSGPLIRRTIRSHDDAGPNHVFGRGMQPNEWEDEDWNLKREGNQWNWEIEGNDYSNYPDAEYSEKRFEPHSFGGGRLHSDFDDRPQQNRDSDFRDDRPVRKRGYNSDACVVVSNLPVSVSFKDVRRLFRGMEIPRDGLKLVNNEVGERIGVAFVRFNSHVDARKALSLDGEDGIIVEPCSDEDFDDVIDSYVPGKHLPLHQFCPSPMAQQRFELPVHNRIRSNSPPRKRYISDKSLCMSLKGFPLEVKRVEIREFLKPFRLEGNLNGIVLDVDRNGKRTNVVYVEFEGKRDFEQARQLQEKKFRGASVEMHPVPKSFFLDSLRRVQAFEKDTARKKGEENKEKLTSESVTGNGSNVDGASAAETTNSAKANNDGGYCVKLDGLPYSATMFTVREFFTGLPIVEKGCHVMLNRENQAAGFAFVEFATSEARDQALEKNNSHMGHRYITITAMTRDEMFQAIDRVKKTCGQTDTADLGKGRCIVAMDNVHFRASEEDVRNFFRQFDVFPTNIRIIYNDGRTAGKATVTFRTPQECHYVVRDLNSKLLMGREVVLTLA